MDSKLLIVAFAAAFLTACAQPVFNVRGASAITPGAPPAAIENARGDKAVWGGVIVGVANLEDATELEILAHPLDRSQRPQVERPAYGRFIAYYPGFLEPVTFSRGRQVTVLGEIQGLETGKVGEASYRYPVILTDAIHLWEPEGPGSDVHFGVGIGIIGD